MKHISVPEMFLKTEMYNADITLLVAELHIPFRSDRLCCSVTQLMVIYKNLLMLFINSYNIYQHPQKHPFIPRLLV